MPKTSPASQKRKTSRPSYPFHRSCMLGRATSPPEIHAWLSIAWYWPQVAFSNRAPSPLMS